MTAQKPVDGDDGASATQVAKGAKKAATKARRDSQRPSNKQGAKNAAPNAGRGRPKGSVNKTTKIIKEAFQDAFDELGGVRALVKWARGNPTDFYKLSARLIPVQHTGEGGGPIDTRSEVTVTFKRPGENQS